MRSCMLVTRSAPRRQRRASSTTVARYGRISGMPISGGRKLRVEISTPIAAADSGAMYGASSTTSATSRVPRPASVSGNWPAMSAIAERLAHTANGTSSDSATVNSQIWNRCAEPEQQREGHDPLPAVAQHLEQVRPSDGELRQLSQLAVRDQAHHQRAPDARRPAPTK